VNGHDDRDRLPGSSDTLAELKNTKLSNSSPGLRHLSAFAWRALPYCQAWIGLPEAATSSLARCEEQAAGRWPVLESNLTPRLTAALLMDDIGDTDACIRELEEIARVVRADESAQFTTLSFWDKMNASYALARLPVLGGEPGVDPRRLAPPVGPMFPELRKRKVLACMAIAAGRPTAAPAFFDSLDVDSEPYAAEHYRLRSIAHSAIGDHAGALAAERQSFRLMSERLFLIQRSLASGDEFVIILPDTSLTDAHIIGARATALLAAADWNDIAPDTPIGASVGRADIRDHHSATDVINAADMRMYTHKYSDER
jgi:hypothetical protein